jgi:hypothetical protein
MTDSEARGGGGAGGVMNTGGGAADLESTGKGSSGSRNRTPVGVPGGNGGNVLRKRLTVKSGAGSGSIGLVERPSGGALNSDGNRRQNDEYEADLDDSERDSPLVHSNFPPPLHPSTRGSSELSSSNLTQSNSINLTQRASLGGASLHPNMPPHRAPLSRPQFYQSSRSTLPSGTTPTSPYPGKAIDTDEDGPLKESILDCISAIIGMVPTVSKSSKTIPQRRASQIARQDILLSSSEARKRAAFTSSSSSSSSSSLDNYPDGSPGGPSSRYAGGDSLDDVETMSVASSNWSSEAGSGMWGTGSGNLMGGSPYTQSGLRGNDIRIISLARGDIIIREGQRPIGLWFCIDG